MKQTSRWLISAVAVGSVLVVELVPRTGNGGIVRSVQAREKGCTVATLEGEYLYTGTAQANIDQRDDPTYPRVFAGVFTFDGAGNLSGFDTRSFGGEITRRQAFTGTYTVDSDCTGTVHYFSTIATNWDLFVTRDRNEGNLIRSDDGII